MIEVDRWSSTDDSNNLIGSGDGKKRMSSSGICVGIRQDWLISVQQKCRKCTKKDCLYVWFCNSSKKKRSGKEESIQTSLTVNQQLNLA